MNTSLLQQIGFWLGCGCLVFVAFVTLSPIDLRPAVAEVGVEHFGAFATIAFLFTLAFPRHALIVFGLVAGAALLLELAQVFVPGRHARMADAAVKFAGVVVGTGAAAALTSLLLAPFSRS